MKNKEIIAKIEELLLQNDVLTINEYTDIIINLIINNFTINDTIKLIDKLEHKEIKNWIK